MARPIRTSTLLTFGFLIGAAVYLTHAAYLTLPPGWDEVIWPWQSWPPVPVVRAVMLLCATVTALGAFLLAIELCGALPGVPALFAVAALMAAPLFYMQSMLVLPAMPAAACAVYGLWFAVRRRWVAAAVMFGALAGVVALTSPLFHLRTAVPGLSSMATGVARRLYVLFVADGHVIASGGLMLGVFSGRLRRRRWAIAGGFCLVWFAFCLLCVPKSDRELLPILPVFFTAAVAGFHTLAQTPRNLACGALILALAGGLYWHPLNLPFPVENSLALGEAAELHHAAAAYLQRHAGERPICAGSPVWEELTRPELGYVMQRMNALRECTADGSPEYYVRFAPYWHAQGSLLQHGKARAMLQYLLSVESPLTPEEIGQSYGLQMLVRFEREGQWVEIYGRYLSTRKMLE